VTKFLLCPWWRSRLVGVDLYSVFGALRERQRLLLGLIFRHAATDAATKGAGVKQELLSLAIAQHLEAFPMLDNADGPPEMIAVRQLFE
jgi:hypothetical protein